MATHTREQFQKIVDVLNMLWKGRMSFELVGSLSKSTGNDADIVVTPAPGLPTGIAVEGFARACRETGIEIVGKSMEIPSRHTPTDRMVRTESS